ncbi:MAG: hypothetical protein NC432_02680 [Roseburia sp.]|nr:hypothetical protein [Roseburia sp.]MCM1097133.1 hypothetical protein [Ruminococcus flavefaciens]
MADSVGLVCAAAGGMTGRIEIKSGNGGELLYPGFFVAKGVVIFLENKAVGISEIKTEIKDTKRKQTGGIVKRKKVTGVRHVQDRNM